eukprot:8896466-Pyramimonas_sp.AAC.2
MEKIQGPRVTDRSTQQRVERVGNGCAGSFSGFGRHPMSADGELTVGTTEGFVVYTTDALSPYAALLF